MAKRLSIITLIILAISVGGLIYVWSSHRSVRTPPPSTQIAIDEVMAEEQEVVEVGSPDGKWALKRSDNTFTMIDLSSGTEKVVLDKILPQDTTLTIPLNTFSPTDKYIFLKEESPSGTKYLVLPGENVEIGELFTAKYPEYVITDVTGWGGYTQLVVNTNKLDGSIGPTIWFDAATHSFYKLSTRFN